MNCEYLEEYGVYVTDDGKVMREIAQWEDCRGYFQITIGGKKNHKNLQVHRLVAKAFIPHDEETGHIVMHKDDNPHNNQVDNLQWGTSSQNNDDAYAHGLKPRALPVRCMETGIIYQSCHKAAIEIGRKPKAGDHIAQVCRSERPKAYGYHWELLPYDEFKKYVAEKGVVNR